MNRKWSNHAMFGLIGLALWANGTVRGQDGQQTPQASSQLAEPRPASQAALSAPPATSPSPQIEDQAGGRVLPSTQYPGASTPAISRAMVAQLRNPFEWQGPPVRRGLFGSIPAQPSPQYPGIPPAVGAAPPGGLPGDMGMPGAPPAAGNLPGAEAPHRRNSHGRRTLTRRWSRGFCRGGRRRPWVRRGTGGSFLSLPHDR